MYDAWLFVTPLPAAAMAINTQLLCWEYAISGTQAVMYNGYCD
jgi:hypothetical protein